MPTLTPSSTTTCPSTAITLTITGNLNDATNWHVYTGSCGGTLVGTTATNSIMLTPTAPSTTYFVRGEDGAGCVNETTGLCANTTITVNSIDDASFSYAATTYCATDTDPTPTITGLTGGTFSSTAGLAINTTNGTIDLDASTAGAYTVTYTTAGACPNSSTASVTINTCATCDITAFNLGATPVQCGNIGTYSVEVSWTDGPDASVSLVDANATISGDNPALVANGTAILAYPIGTDANIVINDTDGTCVFGPLTQVSPTSTPIDYMPIEGTCDDNPQITLPAGYTCAYQFLTGTHSGNTGSGPIAVYPAALVNGDQGTVQYTITTPCGSTETVDVNFICVSCSGAGAANSGSWD